MKVSESVHGAHDVTRTPALHRAGSTRACIVSAPKHRGDGSRAGALAERRRDCAVSYSHPRNYDSHGCEIRRAGRRRRAAPRLVV